MRCLFFIILLPLSLFAQNDKKIKLDSIHQLLDTIQDEERLFLTTYQVAEEHVRTNPEIAISLAQEILENAEQEEDHREKTSALYLLGRAYLNNSQPLIADSIYKKSIEYELSFSQVDTAKLAWVYHNTANYYKKRGAYEKAINFFEKSYELEILRNNLVNQASCQLNIGAMYLYLGRNTEAEAPLQKSKEISLSIGDTATAQSCINNIALIYQSQGDYRRAISTLDSAALYTDSTDDTAYIFGDKAKIYQEMGNTARAIHFYQRAQNAFDQLGMQLEKGQVIIDIGILFKNEGQYDRSLKLYKEAESIFKSAKNANYLAAVTLKQGELFDEQNMKDSATLYLNKALTMAKEVQNIGLLGSIHLTIGERANKNELYEKAAINFEKALNYFKQSHDIPKTIEAQIQLAQCEQQLGNNTKALNYILLAREKVEQINQKQLKVELYETLITDFYSSFSKEELRSFHQITRRLNDSIRSDENAKAIAKLGARYQLKEMTDSITYTNKLLEKERAVRQAELKVSEQRRNLLWYVGIGGLILMVLLIVLFFNRRKIRQKQAENELLLGEIHHRVKNNLQVISSLLSLQEKNITDESAKKALTDGKSRVKSIALIHKLLYQHDEFSRIDIKEYTKTLLSTIATTYGLSKDDFVASIHMEDSDLDIDTAIPIGLIINELINNSLKYAIKPGNNDEITIRFSSDQESYCLTYNDPGNVDQQTLENSKSFGFRMVNSLTRQLSGRLSVHNENGLEYEFRFPKTVKK